MRSPLSPQTRRDRSVVAALTDQEARDAITAAVHHVTSKRPNSPEQRVRVLGAELLIEKPERPTQSPERRIQVLIVDYTGKQILRVLIAPPDQIVRVEHVRGQVAFHRDEVTEARAIAEGDDRLARVIQHPGLFVSATAPAIQVPDGTRVIALRYVTAQPEQRYHLLASAVVDLNAQAIIHLDLYSDAEVHNG